MQIPINYTNIISMQSNLDKQTKVAFCSERDHYDS